MHRTRKPLTEPPDTDRRALETALRRAEARLDGIVGIAADAVISINHEQRIVFFNQGAERIFGWGAHEVVGESLDVLLPLAARGIHRHHVAAFGAGEEQARRMGHRREISGRRRSGEEFPAEASISKHTVDGETLYHVVLRDITDRHRADRHQRFLAEAGEVLTGSLDVPRTLTMAASAAVPALGDACVIWLVDHDTSSLRVLAARALHEDSEASPLLERLQSTPIPLTSSHGAVQVVHSGGTLRFIVGDRSSALHEVGVARLLYAAVVGEGAPPLGAPAACDVHGLFVPIRAAGSTRGVLALYNAAGSFVDDTSAVAEDFARRLALAVDNGRLYERAQRAIRARDDTIAVVSHDLRNPVSAINMIAGVLHARAVEPGVALQSVRDELATILHGARQADTLIQDLLDVARIEAGVLHIEREPLDLSKPLSEAAELLRPLADERGLQLSLEVPRDLPVVAADAERLQQVVSNLVGNAVKFTPAGGRVTLAARQEDGEIVVSVQDTGRGIPAEQVEKLFDRYWQGNPRARSGAGLGLAIARGIVEAHGGRLRVESTSGAGSSFSFSLPVLRDWRGEPDA